MNITTVKTHLHENKKVYIAGAVGIVAGITCVMMRDIISQSLSHGTSVTAQDGISVLGKKVVMNNVSYFASNRQGPPSWVIRCLENGDVYTSQSAAASTLNLSPQEISKHLNGLMDHVRGYHFERLCMAA
jgi:hypothetical protein